MAHRLPEAFGFLALLVGGYALIRIALWYIFTRHLSKNSDGDCLKGGRCIKK